MLFATVIGLGSIGIFFSALTRRTGASTGLTFVTTLALVIGSFFVFVFLGSTGPTDSNGLRKQPSEAILYLNPFVAQADVACGTEDGFGGWCGFMSGILGPIDQQFPPDVIPTKPQPGFGIGGGVAPAPVLRGVGNDGTAVLAPGVGIDLGTGTGGDVSQADTADSLRDRFWPKTVISLLALAALLTTASVQFVTPTRRWRPSLPGPVRRLIRRRSAP